jgi:hypothetical protein
VLMNIFIIKRLTEINYYIHGLGKNEN